MEYNIVMTQEDVAKLKKTATMVYSLPENAQEIIRHYANLELGGKKVQVPYYINKPDPVPTRPGEFYKVRKSLSRALVSKGSPSEIEGVVKKYARKYNFPLEEKSIGDIQDFIYTHGIGIDCSGYIVWILNEVTKLKFNKELWNLINIPSANPLKKLITMLRPLENISVVTLRNNSQKIKNLNDVRPGDIIITRPKKILNHILLITETGVKNDKLVYMAYTQSTAWYSEHSGIISGTIAVKDQKKHLVEQVWFEENVKHNFTYDGVKDDPQAAKVMRLNCFIST